MITMTRRETLAGAIALLSGWSAAEVRGRAGITGQRSASGSETAPRLQSAGQSRTSTRTQSGERAEAGLVFEHDFPNLAMDEWEVTVSVVDYAPGRVGKVHHHAGFVLAYVREGMIVTKISGQEGKTCHPAEMSSEPPGSTHQVSSYASEKEA